MISAVVGCVAVSVAFGDAGAPTDAAIATIGEAAKEPAPANNGTSPLAAPIVAPGSGAPSTESSRARN